MVRVNAVLNVLAFVILVLAGLMVIPWCVSLYVDDGVSESYFQSIGLTLLFGYIFGATHGDGSMIRSYSYVTAFYWPH